MSFWPLDISTDDILTFLNKDVGFYSFPKRKLITITLVISREDTMMFNLFRVKTQIELQIDEYTNWKSRYSIYASAAHKEVLQEFYKKFGYKNVSEVALDDVQSFYDQVQSSNSYFRAIKSMEAIRSFMRYYRKLHNINPKAISNEGIIDLRPVAKNTIIPLIMKKRPVGRPLNVAYITKIKRWVDEDGLGISAIARAERKNKSTISRAYNRVLPSKVA